MTVTNPVGGSRRDSNVQFFTVTRPRSTVTISQMTVPTPVAPSFLALADFNGDHKLDLVIVGASNVILLGNGDGTFTTGVTLPVTGKVAVADFNHDGKSDIAVLNAANSVDILLGNGDGTFGPPISSVTGGGRFGLIAGDFNGDGNEDLAVTVDPSPPNEFAVILGKGDGTFGAPNIYFLSTGNGSIPSNFISGDFNNDGIPDLGVLSVDFDSGNVTTDIDIGNGDGSFTSVGLYFNTYCAATADFNRDGNLDIVYGDAFNDLNIILGQGNGQFGSAVQYRSDAECPVVAADLNGDNKRDIVQGTNVNGKGILSIVPGKGDGSFGAPISYNTGYAPAGIIVADFNGDGKLDVVNSDDSENSLTVSLQK